MMETSKVVAEEAKEQAQQANPLNVGMTLREAREAQGLNVHDIADRVKFAPRQVEALESNDFANLPTATFLRGFVRSYARVLQLDEEALIAALPSESLRKPAVKEQAAKVVFSGQITGRRINLIWLAGALGIALVLGLFVWIGGSESVQKPPRVVTEPVPLPEMETNASAVAASQTQAENVEPAKAAEPGKEEQAKVAAVAPEQVRTLEKANVPEKENAVDTIKAPEASAVVKPVIIASAPAAAVTQAETKPSVPLEMLKRRPLHFVFSGEAWVEVVDVNGGLLLSRTNQAGTEKWIGGPRRAPYDIAIGNPGNVKLYYKGKEIDLSAYAGMEVARIKVE